MKRIAQIAGSRLTASVYRNVEWDEYIVRFFEAGRDLGRNADYHTDDKQDALDTARLECEADLRIESFR